MQKRDTHIFTKEKHGWYVEPFWVSERLFQQESFPGPIFDPACGFGTIVHAARAAGHKALGADIVDRRTSRFVFLRRDFLKTAKPIQGSVVTNPPFDLVREFAEHTLRLGAKKVALIFLVRRLNAAHWLQALPLQTVYLLTPRPSMPPGTHLQRGGKASGGTQDFCWLILTPGHRGPPQLKWLRRDPSM
jgi:hypothetical protein